jgi:carboxyl-terminal processing protease
MRWIVACLGLIVSSALVRGDTVPKGEAARPPLAERELASFVVQLKNIVTGVEANYVRPVLRADLIGAVTSGLFEAARLAVPAVLTAELEQARQKELAAVLIQELCGSWPLQHPRAAELQNAAHTELAGLLRQAREQVGDVEALRGRKGLEVCIHAMVKALDPYSGLVTPEDSRRLGLDEEAMFGVGLEFIDYQGIGPLEVKAVVPGGPAQKAGLRPGDRITQINDKILDGQAGILGLALLRSRPAGSDLEIPVDRAPVGRSPLGPINIVYERPGTKGTQKTTLECDQYDGDKIFGVMRRDDNSWDYWLDRRRRIAYARLGPLTSGIAKELAARLSALREEHMTGLILDLRGCPGGLLHESAYIAHLFVGSENVATVRSRRALAMEFQQWGGPVYADFPLLVLVNGQSSGGAELIAAALQDYRRALVAGQRTFGKGSIQSQPQFDLEEPVQIKLTSGTFIRPNGKNLHRFPFSQPSDDWGVRPDAGLEFPVTPELNRQLQHWWLLQSLRPGSSREILPLDDSANDPQRLEAMRALRDRIQQRRKRDMIH